MQKVVAVDIGNSSMKIARHSKDKLFRISADRDPEMRSTGLDIHMQGYEEGSQWLVCSVDSQQTEWLRDWVSYNRPNDDFHVISASDIPLDSKVEDREALGRDRLLGAWYASVRSGSGSTPIVVDAGTAVTIDVVVEFEGHVGGLIFPGVHTCLSTVSDRTDALPDLSKSPFPKLMTQVQLGTSTEPAILLGTHQLQLFGIVSMVRSLEQQYPNPKVWCCGGALAGVAHLLPESWNYNGVFLIEAIFHLKRYL